MLLQMSSNRMCRTRLIILLTIFIFLFSGISNADLLQKTKKDILSSQKAKPEIKNNKDLFNKSSQGQTTSNQSYYNQQYNQDNQYNQNNQASVQLHVWVGPCNIITDVLNSINSFKEKYKEVEVHYYMVPVKNSIDLTKFAEKLSFVKFEGREEIPQKVPYFIFTDRTKSLKVTGLIDLEYMYKEFKESSKDIEKGIEGRYCETVIPEAKVEKPSIDSNQIKQIQKKIKEAFYTDVPHGELQIKKIKSEGSQYLPFNKFIAFSKKDLEWASKELKNGAWGCCVDCDKLIPQTQPCSNELLQKLNIKSIPAIIEFL